MGQESEYRKTAGVFVLSQHIQKSDWIPDNRKIKIWNKFYEFPNYRKNSSFLDKFHHQFQFIRQSVLNHVPRAPLCPMCLWPVSTFIYSRAFIFYVNYEPSFFHVLTLNMLIKITQMTYLWLFIFVIIEFSHLSTSLLLNSVIYQLLSSFFKYDFFFFWNEKFQLLLMVERTPDLLKD